MHYPIYKCCSKPLYTSTFKGLVVDLSLSILERNQSREFFRETSCQEAFRLIKIELNYLYDVLFTKIHACDASQARLLLSISILHRSCCLLFPFPFSI